MYKVITPLLFLLQPETAHRLTLKALRYMPASLARGHDDPARLSVSLWDRQFPNPIGLAAGFDKNAESLSGLFGLGFGFVEAGTVTLKPQEGNPTPRVFRCPERRAVINRMGFPNLGAARFKENLESFLRRKPRPVGVLGVNIGMNKDQTDPASDYTALLRTLAPMADYLTINISSPNTPGLRNLQEKGPLTELLTAVLEERKRSCGTNPPPVLVKLAPDLDETQLTEIAEVLLSVGIDGVILTNTTLERPADLPADFAEQKGGLSGAPLTLKSTRIIHRFYALTGGRLPIIGAGGVSSGAEAYAKIRAGASLVQLYSALIYEGPGLVARIKSELDALLARDGFKTVADAVGADHRRAPEQERSHA